VVEKAEHACLVSASLATPIRLELQLLESESTALAAEVPRRTSNDLGHSPPAA
jgi:hypothetical protein